MDKELRKIPLKNYIILGVVLIFTFLLVYYLYMWFDAYKETKLNMPILDKYMDVINYNELDNYLTENPNSIIYVSVLEDASIRNFEKKFKKLFKNNEITNTVLYLDITDVIKDKKLKKEVKEKYSINAVSIIDVPVIMIFDDGNLKSIYSISKENYDIDRIKVIINNVTFSDEDELNG